jgi:hypothetical protein
MTTAKMATAQNDNCLKNGLKWQLAEMTTDQNDNYSK